MRARRVWISAVQSPKGAVQDSGETHPTDVGRHQPRRACVQAAEGENGRPDANPQDKDFTERGADGVLAKKDPRPGEVEAKLDGKQEQRTGAQFGWRLLADLPGGNRHQQIENGPDGTKDPVRRSERGTYESAVPPRNLAEVEASTTCSNPEAKQNPEQQNKPAHAAVPFLVILVSTEVDTAQSGRFKRANGFGGLLPLAQKADAGGDDLEGVIAGRHPVWFWLVPKSYAGEPRFRTPGTVIFLFFGSSRRAAGSRQR